MVIFAADNHLAPRTWTNRWSIAGDAYYSLKQLGDRVLQSKCAGVVLGGDTTDANLKDDETLHHLSVFCQRLAQAGIPIWYVCGQHDRGSNGHTALDTYGARRLDGEVAVLDGVTFRGLSHGTRAELLAALPNVPPADFLVLHCAFKHLLGFAGAWQLEAEEIPPHFTRVLVGDIHKHDVSRFRDSLTVYSPGSAYATSVDEIEEVHGWFEIARDKAGKITVEHQRYLTRPFVQLDMERQGMDYVVGAMQNVRAVRTEPPTVVFLRAPAGTELPAEWLDGKAIVVRLDAPIGLTAETPDALAVETGGGLLAALPAVVDRAANGEVYSFVEGLLGAADAKQHLAEWLAKEKVPLVES